MREFVSKTKLIKVTVNGASYEMRSPTIGESEALENDLKNAEPSDVFSVYRKHFAAFGLPEDVTKNFDYEDFLEFITFVLNPKKSGTQTTK